MQPIPRELVAAMGADALGNLVLMVRENQIETAAMNVESLAEFGLAHRRAFDVPARSAAPPRAVPAGHVLARRLPQHEVARVLFVRRNFDTGAGDHIGSAAPR